VDNERDKQAEFLRLMNGLRSGDPEVVIATAQAMLELLPQIRRLPPQVSREREQARLLVFLGDAYQKRRLGTPAENLEAAIKAYEAALTFLSRETFPMVWAQTQYDLAGLYRKRTTGAKADNLEAAIHAMQAVLSVITYENNPQGWARAQSDLATLYTGRIEGSPTYNLEAAIKGYKEALTVLTRDAFPQDWAAVQDNLADAYTKTKNADNLESAIEGCEAALTVRTREAFPREWAATQNNLGNAYANRIKGLEADNLDAAIKAYEAALTVRTREALPQEWAQTLNNLGIVHRERINGSKADNLDAAIKAFEDALTVRTRETLRLEWATTLLNLAPAYSERVRGSKADNLEAAIKAAEAALTVYTREGFPQDWALLQNNLAGAYTRRIRGRKDENLEAGLSATSAALTVYTREAFPREWARTQHNLAPIYINRVKGSRAENLEAGVNAASAALTVYTRETFPQEWASTQNNLALANIYRIKGSKADNLEAAWNAASAALTVYAREAFPQQWAMTQHNLALAYVNRVKGSKSDNLEAGIKAYRAALTVRKREALPRDHLLTARLLGQALLEQHNWRAAKDIYVSAHDAFRLLFGQGLEETEAEDLIAEAGPLFSEAAYAAVETGDLARAFNLLSEGKAQLMAVALRLQSLDLPPEELAQVAKLRAEIRNWELQAEAKGEEGARALQHLVELRQELDALVKEGSANKSIDAVRLAHEVLPEGGALIAPLITEVGAKVLLVTGDKNSATVSVLDLTKLTTAQLDETIRGRVDDGGSSGWLGAYMIQDLPQSERILRYREWVQAIESIGPDLWQLFAGPIVKGLAARGIKPGVRIIVLPTSALGILPLGLAQDPTTGDRLIETYEMVQAPSLLALAAAARRIATQTEPTLAAVINPNGLVPDLALPFAEVEGALVAAYFKPTARIMFDQSSATPAAVLAALKDRSYWHFSTHGSFNWADARESGLMMKDEKELTVGRLLQEREALGNPRLVVLSACESGLYDTHRNPDEFIGLPATFMELGAAGVVSTLWQVDDLATALLVARFYDLHLDHKMPPATALRKAQDWLRTASRAKLIAFGRAQSTKAKLAPAQLSQLEASLKSRRRSGTRSSFWNMLQDFAEAVEKRFQSYPFAHPYYWGGFIYTGL
jgi:CHAT domain-containing protein